MLEYGILISELRCPWLYDKQDHFLFPFSISEFRTRTYAYTYICYFPVDVTELINGWFILQSKLIYVFYLHKFALCYIRCAAAEKAVRFFPISIIVPQTHISSNLLFRLIG